MGLMPNKNRGGVQHQGTPKTERTSSNQQATRKRVKERNNRLVEAGAQTMLMVKQKKKKRANKSKHNPEKKPKTNLTAMVVLYLVVGGSY
jgi:hypothetical protein